MRKNIFAGVLVLILGVLACSIPGPVTPVPPPPGAVTTTAPIGDGITPVVTDVPVLPPPAVAPALRVAYVKAGNIWLWTEGVGAVQLTVSGADRSPNLSPDGQQVAFQRGQELLVVRSDGSGLRTLVSAAYLSGLVLPSSGTAVLHWFEWMPASTTIWFGTSTSGEAYTIPNRDLFSVNAESGAAPVMLQPAGSGGATIFSPNGLYAAVVQPERILLMNTDGSGIREALTYPVVLTYSEWNYLPEVVWFADSSEFRTVIPAADALSNPFSGTYFWSVPVSGIPVQMAGFVAVPVFQDTPRISPDGLNVAYMAPSGDNTELHLNGFTIGDVMYSSAPANQWGVIGWSADSAGFVYWAGDPRSLWLGHIGSAAVPLTDTPQASYVSWIDATRILFLNGGELRLGAPAGASSVIDLGVDGMYDFLAP